MSRILWRKWVATAAVAFLALGGSVAQAQQYKMRIQTAVPTSSIYFELLKKFGDRVEKMSGGAAEDRGPSRRGGGAGFRDSRRRR